LVHVRKKEATAEFHDLRDWVDKIDSWGQLKRFPDVDWNLEMGGIVDLAYHKARGRRSPCGKYAS